jgi:hypothetical protein
MIGGERKIIDNDMKNRVLGMRTSMHITLRMKTYIPWRPAVRLIGYICPWLNKQRRDLSLGTNCHQGRQAETRDQILVELLISSERCISLVNYCPRAH